MNKHKCKFCKKPATRFADIELKPDEHVHYFTDAGKVYLCDDHIESVQVYLIPNNPQIEYHV